MRQQTVADLFDIQKGDHIAIARATATTAPDAVPVVSRSGRNNGVVLRIERLANRDPWPGDCSL
jgi:hypothetical protein